MKFCPECETKTEDKEYTICPHCGVELIDKSIGRAKEPNETETLTKMSVFVENKLAQIIIL